MTNTKENNSKVIKAVLLFFSLSFIAMSVIYGVMNNCAGDIFPGFIRILKTPAQCTQDLYGVSIPGAFLNMGLSSLLMMLFIFATKCVANGTTIAAFFLTLGFTTWGMNPLNMIPSMLGVLLYAKVKKKTPASVCNMCMFSTALAPLMSELMLRWPMYGKTLNDAGEIVYPLAAAGMQNLAILPLGIVFALILGIVIGFVMPPVCAHAPNMHKGYDLFNAGPAAGFLCCIVVGFLFKLTNIAEPKNGPGVATEVFGFVFISYLIIFIVCLIWGIMLDKDAFKNFGKLIKDSGHGVDFIEKYGMGATLINFAVYGVFILAFYTFCKFAFGAKFSGPIAGVVWCAFTWVAAGTHFLNVLPIAVGYVITGMFSTMVCPAIGVGADAGRLGMDSVAILIAFSYATGMAPVSGDYGFIAGVVAGIIHFVIVTLSPRLYYFFNYYNGGMTAGLVVFELVPVLEAYFPKKVKQEA